MRSTGIGEEEFEKQNPRRTSVKKFLKLFICNPQSGRTFDSKGKGARGLSRDAIDQDNVAEKIRPGPNYQDQNEVVEGASGDFGVGVGEGAATAGFCTDTGAAAVVTDSLAITGVDDFGGTTEAMG